MDDPVYARWKRRHPKFPGVTKCVALLGRRNVTGGLVDVISGELQANATAHGTELIAAFRAERDGRVRSILLSIMRPGWKKPCRCWWSTCDQTMRGCVTGRLKGCGAWIRM
jgi:hypothetical protein